MSRAGPRCGWSRSGEDRQRGSVVFGRGVRRFLALIEIELADDLKSEQIALQDADLGVEIALVVVVDDGHRVFRDGFEAGYCS